MFINDNNFKLIGFALDSEYNDYTQHYRVFEGTSKEEALEMEKNFLMGKENCDEYYNVDIAPIYEILNKEYLQFTNLGILEYMDEDKPLFENKNILVGSVEVYKFKTPKNRIPSSVELIKYIHSTNIVDVNGLVIKENVIDLITKLEMLIKK